MAADDAQSFVRTQDVLRTEAALLHVLAVQGLNDAFVRLVGSLQSLAVSSG